MLTGAHGGDPIASSLVNTQSATNIFINLDKYLHIGQIHFRIGRKKLCTVVTGAHGHGGDPISSSPVDTQSATNIF